MAQMLGLVVVLALFFFHPSPVLSAINGFRLAKQELLQHAAQNRHLEENTKAALLSPSESLVAEVQPFRYEYIVNLAIGSPPVPFPAFPSTVTDLTWTQCEPCLNCFNQTTPIYDPSASSSFSNISCNQTQFEASPAFKCTADGGYNQQYVSGSSEGVLGVETFDFGNTSVAGVVFGCGNSNTFQVSYGSGIVGLGRGALSLVSQLGVQKFSYCLPFEDESNGRLFFGSQADFNENLKALAQSTPLVRNAFNPSFYYLSLKGITLGETRLSIPIDAFQLKENGTGGVVISTGAPFTRLEKTAFGLLKEELGSQLGLPLVDGSSVGFDTCFSLPANSTVKFPKLIYNFAGADFDVHVSRYLVEFPSKNLLCMMIYESSSGLSVFGNIHQQNFHIVYDLEKEMLSFAPTQCSKL